MPVRSGLTTRQPASGLGSTEDRLAQLENRIESLSGRVSKMQGPGLRPQGPTQVRVDPVGTTNLISFRADAAEASGVGYRIWRADAGTRNVPTTPSSASAILIGAIPAIWSRPNAAEPYVWADRDFTPYNLDPSNPTRFCYWVSTATIEEESPKILAAGSPVEVLQNGPGDQSAEEKFSPFNKFYNANIESSVTTANVAIGVGKVISGATNATPIVITTTTNHGLATGDFVQIHRVSGNVAANGLWQITVLSPTTFSLDTSVGSGAYAGGGTAIPRVGQPDLPAGFDSGGSLLWSVWYTDAGGVAEFVSDGAFQTGEVRLLPDASNVSDLVQIIDSTKFRRGLHMTLSVFVRAPIAPNDIELSLRIVRPSLSEDVVTIDGSRITTDHRRIVFNFSMSETLVAEQNIFFIFRSTLKPGGTPREIFLFKPMLAIGDIPPGWTSQIDEAPQPGATTVVDDTQTPTWSRFPKSITLRSPLVSISKDLK